MREVWSGTICVCYIYFRYSDRTEMTVRNVLEIIVKQTLERHPDCKDVVDRTYAQHLKEGSAPTVAHLLQLLRELAGRMTCTFYVLDALDEAPTRIQLAVVQTLASLHVKIFITSRPLEAVQAKFSQAFTITIAAQQADIDLHVAKAIDESASLQSLLKQEEPSLRGEIFFTIKRNCGGMYGGLLSTHESIIDYAFIRFLHASLQLEALRECMSAEEVRRTLSAFPSMIDDVYLYTWRRILNQKAEHVLLAKALLVWVLNAKRSMTVEEIRMAVATSLETHQFEAGRMVPCSTLISLSHGLVTVEEESQLVRLVRKWLDNVLMLILTHRFKTIQRRTRCDGFSVNLSPTPTLSSLRSAWPILLSVVSKILG
jgi:ankyrin repeat domain-containing protein 50